MVIHFVKSLKCPDAMRNFCNQLTIVGCTSACRC